MRSANDDPDAGRQAAPADAEVAAILRDPAALSAALVCCENMRPLEDSGREVLRERNSLRRLLEIQGRERRLVSYDIHDGLCQYLNGVWMHLQAHDHATPSAPACRRMSRRSSSASCRSRSPTSAGTPRPMR